MAVRARQRTEAPTNVSIAAKRLDLRPPRRAAGHKEDQQ